MRAHLTLLILAATLLGAAPTAEAGNPVSETNAYLGRVAHEVEEAETTMRRHGSALALGTTWAARDGGLCVVREYAHDPPVGIQECALGVTRTWLADSYWHALIVVLAPEVLVLEEVRHTEAYLASIQEWALP